MFGIGPLELLVICVAVLVFVGPKRLPEMMRQFGKFFVQAKRYSSDIRDTVSGVIRDAEVELQLEEAKKLREEAKKLALEMRPDHTEHAQVDMRPGQADFDAASDLSKEDDSKKTGENSSHQADTPKDVSPV